MEDAQNAGPGLAKRKRGRPPGPNAKPKKPKRDTVKATAIEPSCANLRRLTTCANECSISATNLLAWLIVVSEQKIVFSVQQIATLKGQTKTAIQKTMNELHKHCFVTKIASTYQLATFV